MSGVNHDCRDGSGVQICLGSPGLEPAKLETGKGISDIVLCTHNVRQQHSEIVRGCCVKQGADKGHQWLAPREAEVPP